MGEKYPGIRTIVSIHAPTRGATPLRDRAVPAFVVSIHAPTRGATRSRPGAVKLSPFQSTLPHGERLVAAVIWLVLMMFQSTLPHGERPIGDAQIEKELLFQSTLPHGERLSYPNHEPPSVGRIFLLSIQAPSRGATKMLKSCRRERPGEIRNTSPSRAQTRWISSTPSGQFSWSIRTE